MTLRMFARSPERRACVVVPVLLAAAACPLIANVAGSAPVGAESAPGLLPLVQNPASGGGFEFSAPENYSVQGDPYALASADFDGVDGPDVVA